MGNPLLNPRAFNVQRRWDDDVIFKNQARGTEQKGKKEFVNVCIYLAWTLRSTLTIFQDLLRSDFHKRFMVSSIIYLVSQGSMRKGNKVLSDVLLRMYLILYYEIVLCVDLADGQSSRSMCVKGCTRLPSSNIICLWRMG